MLQETAQWLTSGASGFAVYWAILAAAALAETANPAVRPPVPSAPRWRVNLYLGLIFFVTELLPVMANVSLAALVQQQGFGLLPLLALPGWAAFVVSFLLADLLGYATHRLAHQWPLLWRLHRVHHSDNDVDLTTLFRTHPLSIPVMLAIQFAGIAALGLDPVALVVFGLAKLLTMAFGHAAMGSGGRIAEVLALVIVTPYFHRRHHSAWQPETDSNYGEVLTVWDRLFGTCAALDQPVERYGLGDNYDSEAASLAGQLKLPFVSR